MVQRSLDFGEPQLRELAGRFSAGCETKRDPKDDQDLASAAITELSCSSVRGMVEELL